MTTKMGLVTYRFNVQSGRTNMGEDSRLARCGHCRDPDEPLLLGRCLCQYGRGKGVYLIRYILSETTFLLIGFDRFEWFPGRYNGLLGTAGSNA